MQLSTFTYIFAERHARQDMPKQGCNVHGWKQISGDVSQDIQKMEENNSKQQDTQVIVGWLCSNDLRITTFPNNVNHHQSISNAPWNKYIQ